MSRKINEVIQVLDKLKKTTLTAEQTQLVDIAIRTLQLPSLNQAEE